MLVNFGSEELVRSPQEITRFVEQLVERLIDEGLYQRKPDRRSEPRHAIAVQVRAMPLDARLKPAGEPFMATTRDLSARGIGLVHTEPLECELLGVELDDADGNSFQAAVEVLRCEQVGHGFVIGGQFVTKIYRPPNRSPSAGKALDYAL